VCQRNKGETLKALGSLQNLHIPNQRYEEVSMEFIIGLPKSKGKDTTFVVLDRLTKYAHFCGIQSTYIASQVMEVFVRKFIDFMVVLK
jgi:hypothetical protein